MAKGNETITVVRKPRVDKLKPTSGVEQRFDIEGCIVWPRAAVEEGRGWIQKAGQNVFAPAGSDIRPDDEVIVRGLRYSVEGIPGDFRSRRGKRKGLLVNLERVGATPS